MSRLVRAGAALARLSLLAVAACGPLVDYTTAYEAIEITSPTDGATVLGSSEVAVQIRTSCADVRQIDILVDDETAAYGQGTPCDQGARCFSADIGAALRHQQFWPARVQAQVSCSGRAGTFVSDPIRVHMAPFARLAFLPAEATGLLPGAADLIAVSDAGLHRLDTTTAGAPVATFASTAVMPSAFRVGDDVYFHALCDDPLHCAPAAPDLFRFAAATLTPTGARDRLGCAPLAVAATAGDRRAMVLGCAPPRVRWTAADLSAPVEALLDAQPTGVAVAQGGALTFTAFRGDEVVIVFAGAAPPLAVHPTGVRAAGAATAISDDAARAAALDVASGALTVVEAATGRVVTAVSLPAHGSRLDLRNLAFVPGTHRVLATFVDALWLADGDDATAAPRALPGLVGPEIGQPMSVRAAVPLDADRIVYLATFDDGAPSLLFGHDGTVDTLASLGVDWTLTAPPVVRDHALSLAFATAQGPVIVQQPLAP